MTQQNDIPADNTFDVELKTLVDANFFTLAYEIEEHIRHGWRIHQQHYPVHLFTHYEVTLYKNIGTINRVRDSILGVIGARGEAVKEKSSELAKVHIVKAHEKAKRESQQRKTGKDAQTMLESVLKVKEGGDES